MIDIHTHLLPGVDDGSSELDDSLKQLQILAEAGVSRVYFTPHYMRNVYMNTQKVLEPLFNEICQKVQTAGLKMELRLGCEYFLDAYAAEIINEERLTLGASNYILVETMMQQIPSDFTANIYQLQKAGYRIILAHPERYQDFILNPELVEELMHRDIYLQVNAGSFLGIYGKAVERTAFRLLDEGWLHFIASDNHANQEVSFQAIIFQMISENLSEAIAQKLLVENPGSIEDGKSINVFNHWRLPRRPKNFWQKTREFFTGHE